VALRPSISDSSMNCIANYALISVIRLTLPGGGGK
jgi:hypothetical protein